VRSDDTPAYDRLMRAMDGVPVGNWCEVVVPRLTKDGVTTLVEPAGLDVDAVFSVTGGNPFFVSELVKSRVMGEIPSSVRHAVLERVASLLPGTREVLIAASISPEEFSEAFVAAVVGRTVTEALATCRDVGLLLEHGGRYRFQHELGRQAIEQSATILQRKGFNSRALAYLSARKVSISKLVHHAKEANDIPAIHFLAPDAAKQASAVGAHRQALRHLEVAVAFSDDLDELSRANLFAAVAFESHLIGLMERAIAAQLKAFNIYRNRGNILKEADSLRWLSRLSYLAGNRNDADRYGTLAIELLERLSATPELAMAYSNAAQLAMLASEAETAEDMGRRAIALAGPAMLNCPDILCHALNNVATATCRRDPGRARSMLDESLEIALDHDYQEHAARIYTNRGWVEMRLFAADAAEAILRRGIAYCVERDLDTWRDYMRGELAELFLLLGRWDEAAALASSVIDNSNAAPLVRYPAAITMAVLKTRRGQDVDHLLDFLARFHKNGRELQRLAPYAD